MFTLESALVWGRPPISDPAESWTNTAPADTAVYATTTPADDDTWTNIAPSRVDVYTNTTPAPADGWAETTP